METSGAAMLVGMLAGESPVRGTYPVATVVISGDGAGDQSVESRPDSLSKTCRGPKSSRRSMTTRTCKADDRGEFGRMGDGKTLGAGEPKANSPETLTRN